MSVIGIDFGNYKTCIAVARNRGIDIVTNEVSNRFTPTMVSFNGNQRFLGEGAKTQEVMNCKNTVTNLKRLIGRDFKESEIQDFEKKYLFFNLAEAENGSTAAKVQYNGEQQIFDSTQLLAMFFTQLKLTAETSLQNSVSAAVISVPAYYTDRQRHAILSAAEISHLTCIRLINEPTSAALAYGITRVSDLPEKDPRNVVFVDVGHSALTVSVASFTKEKAEVKATAFDRHIGGRAIDDIIVNHFIEKIKEKHKQDISSNPKTVLRLRIACEKLKHVLSANAQAALQIECLTDTLDISFVMKREELEEIIAHIIEKITSPIRIALHESGFKKEDIHSVEIIGGSTRIPAIQNKIASFFEKPDLLMKTLNMDEAIARGAALQCAISSPLFKVRDYQVKDVTAYGIKISWDPISEDSKSTESVLFKSADVIPATKAITFSRSKPFELRVEYAEKEKLPPGSSSFVGRYMINGVAPVKDNEVPEVKIKARVNESGIFSIESAELIEEVEAVPASPAPMETDKAPAADKDASGDVNMEEAKKKKVRKPLTVESKSSSLTSEVLNKFREIEGQMIASDKLILETQEKKNALESYIYEVRGKVEGTHAEFIASALKEEFLTKLTDIENWLYEEGETATKSTFIEKLTSLQKIGQPMEARFREADERPSAVSDLEKAIAQFKGHATSDDPKYEHIEPAEKQKVLAECEKREKWLQEGLEALAKQSKAEDPKILVSQIKSQRESLVLFSAPILNKPKPKPKEEPPKEAPKEAPKEGEQPAATEQPAPSNPEEQQKPKDEMDVD